MKLIVPIVVSSLFGIFQFQHVLSPDTVAYAEKAPSYAKWGKLAMKETQKKYPMAQIIDYQHLWSEAKKDGISMERFKLWLKENKREFGVFVTITFDAKNEEIHSIQMIESPH